MVRKREALEGPCNERAIGDKLADGAVEVEDGFRCWRVIADTLAKFCHLLAKL